MKMTYYDEVGAYYNRDASDFEKRYWQNPVLQQIRQAFREHVYPLEGSAILEIGLGPGFDIAHFARLNPHKVYYGIDVSSAMVDIARKRIKEEGLQNVQIECGSVEDISTLFPGIRFDLIYVFFGALNTVDDLKQAFQILSDLLRKNGKMVLTFVNKWYLLGMLIELLKLKPRQAFARLKKVWGGYSPTEFLASKCYSVSSIKDLSNPLQITGKEGFSIFYPAWYYRGLHRVLPARWRSLLWNTDRRISSTTLGHFGEYMLYIFEH